MICKLGVQWEADGLRRFKLLGWEFYVEGSPEGWRYWWEGDEGRRRVVYPTREAAMRVGLTDLIEAIDYAYEDEEPKKGPRSIVELKAELAKVNAKLAVHYLVQKAREVRGIR
jgi:hypothetical protein